MSWSSAFALAIGGVALGAGLESDADACGACYANQSESTVVQDHRMALSVSANMTVLWDQIAYSGNPKEFAYVIPARRGTRLEVSNDAWFAALDASTRPIIMAPQNPGYGGGGYPNGGRPSSGSGGRSFSTNRGGDGDGVGCCTANDDSSAMFAESGPEWGAQDASAGFGGATSADAGAAAADPVQVVSQEVVGPYETVTVRSEDPEALFDWLAAYDFAVPEESKPIVEDYVKAGLDFIAMRMRPSPTKQARAMEPIRILAPGADPTLPLRMMRIGSGANLGVTLFVLGEARYRAKNFPNVSVDPKKIIWDYSQNRSNYLTLAKEAMTGGDGRGWLTEYAQRPDLYITGSTGQPGMIGNPGLADAYESKCPSYLPYEAPDASFDLDSGNGNGNGDAEVSDAGAPDADAPDADAGADAGDGGAPATLPPRTRKEQCDDLELALTGLSAPDVVLTRLRAFLPNGAMNTPLELEPIAGGEMVDNVHYAATSGTVSARIAPSKGTRGTWALIVVAGIALRSMVMRRRRAK